MESKLVAFLQKTYSQTIRLLFCAKNGQQNQRPAGSVDVRGRAVWPDWALAGPQQSDDCPATLKGGMEYPKLVMGLASTNASHRIGRAQGGR